MDLDPNIYLLKYGKYFMPFEEFKRYLEINNLGRLIYQRKNIAKIHTEIHRDENYLLLHFQLVDQQGKNMIIASSHWLPNTIFTNVLEYFNQYDWFYDTQPNTCVLCNSKLETLTVSIPFFYLEKFGTHMNDSIIGVFCWSCCKTIVSDLINQFELEISLKPVDKLTLYQKFIQAEQALTQARYINTELKRNDQLQTTLENLEQVLVDLDGKLLNYVAEFDCKTGTRSNAILIELNINGETRMINISKLLQGKTEYSKQELYNLLSNE